MDPTTAVAAFERYLQTRQLFLTAQRRQIAEMVFSLDDHFSVESLQERFRKTGTPVAKATVYRTMQLLTDSGLVETLDFDQGFLFYEHVFGSDHHDHLFCLSCQKIVEFQEPKIEALQDRVADRHGFVIERHTLKLFGYCAECQKNNSAIRASAPAGRHAARPARRK
jgi:Fur family ferric uptake transcriptional regulator